MNDYAQFILACLSFLALGLFVYLTIAIQPECAEYYLCFLLGIEKKKEAVQYMGLLGSGLLLSWGIWAANRRAKAMEMNVEVALENAKAARINAKAAEISIRYIEIGHRQERFRDAVAHLGHEKVSVRLGGAYALFQLAQEDETRRAHIAEILCAYIREVTQDINYQDNYKDQPSTEIQSLLNLLFRRSSEETEKLFEGTKINLVGAWLQGANLNEAHLQKSYLIEVHLQKAHLKEAHLQKADLKEAHLQKVDLSNAKLQEANLSGAQLQGALLCETHLQLACLVSAQLQGAFLYETNFQMTSLTKAHLQGTSLEGAQFQGAILYETHFQGAVSQVQYSETDSHQVIRDRINKDSDLSGATFSGGLTDEKVTSMVSAMQDYISEEQISRFKKKMQMHINETSDNEPPDNAVTGRYTEEEAASWWNDR